LIDYNTLFVAALPPNRIETLSLDLILQ